MILPRFELHRPATLEEAVRLATVHPGDFDYIAGGTDLLQNYKNRLNPRGHVISLLRVPNLTDITPIRIGALARLADLGRHRGLGRSLPGLVEAVSRVATPLVREMATLGGNLLVETRCFFLNQSLFWRQSKGSCMKAEGDACLVVPQKETCHATFSGDIAPVLIALGASVELVGPGGSRSVALGEFYRGDGIQRTRRAPEEILTAVTIPETAARYRAGYRKLRIRDAFDYPDLGVAVALRVADTLVEDLRIVLGAIAPVPVDLSEAMASFRGRPLVPAAIDAIAARAEELARPVKNVSMSPSYRRRMVGVFVRRLLHDLVKIPMS